MVWHHLSEEKITEIYDIDCKVAASSKKLKPRGLWLSYNNEWEEWNDTGEPGVFIVGNYKYKYKVTLKKNLNVLKIETVEELYDFNKKYGKKDKVIKKMIRINWEKVCEDYDGIFFMNYRKILDDESVEYNDEFIWYNMLDVSSACIFRPSLVVSKIIEEPL
jgi:hypothetical protein